jgi:RHS repeat-associated protein
MGYVLPGWLDEILDFIGINWPNVDEDDYREMADAMREFAEKFEGHGGEAHAAINRILASSEGYAVDALSEHWGKVKGSHLDKVPEISRSFATACDVVADVIYGMKIKAEVELGVMAASIGISIGLAFVTGGLSALIGAAETAAMRELIRRIIKEAQEEIVARLMAEVTEPVTAKLEKMTEDMILDLADDAIHLPPGEGGGGGGGDAGGGHGGDGGKGGMNLNSAGGGGGGGTGGGGGGGGGAGGRVRIDPDEFDNGAEKLSRHGTDLQTNSLAPLGRAKGAFGRTKGRDPFTQAFDSVLDGALSGSEKALKKVAKHVGEGVPGGVRSMAKRHRDNENSVADSMKSITSRGDGKGPNGLPGGPNPAGKNAPGKNKPPSPELSAKGRNAADKCLGGDPIDMATGEVFQHQTDLELPGILPLVIERTHISGYRNGRFYGPSWASTLDERLEVAGDGRELWWHRVDGSSLRYHHAPDMIGEQVHPYEGHRIPLTCVQGSTAWDLAVTDPRTGLTRRFLPPEDGTQGMWWLGEIEDRNGNGISIDREADGTPTAVRHDGGYHVEVTTDDAALVTAIAVRTPEGPTQVKSYAYDDDRNLTHIVNSSGLPLVFGYDADHRITSWTDRNDSTYQFLYDEHGRVTRTVGPEGYLSSQLEYDTQNRITRYTDSLGAVTTYHLNHLGQVIAETDPLGNTVHREWDRHDNLVSRTDALGHTTRFEWADNHVDLLAVHRPDGTTTRTVYNGQHLPTEITLPNGAVWRQEFDNRGNRTAVVAPDGATTRFTHDPTGATAAVLDPLGAQTQISNNSAGRPLSITDPAGGALTSELDAFGRPTTVTDTLGATTRLEWTVEGKPSRRIGPDGTEERWRWDAEGNCLSHIDAHGAERHFQYTHFDQLTSRTDPDGSRYQFAYDTELHLTQVTNPQGLTWHYTYDRAGHLIAECDFDSREVAYAYDAVGQLTSRTTALGETIRYEHDALGRVVAKDAAGRITQFVHDSVDQIIRAVNPDSTLELEYDLMGRLLSESVDGRATHYAYDASGRRISRTTPTGAVSTSDHDLAGNRTSLSIDGHRLEFAHDTNGREVERSFGDAVTLTSVWNPLGCLVRQELVTNARTQRARSYSYRSDNYLTSITDEVTGTSQHMDLDPMGRPLSVTADDWQESYAYDQAGNQATAVWPESAGRTEARGDRTYEGTRIQRAGSIRYEHDPAGRMTLRQKTRLSRKPDTWRYEWDAEDRLTACTTPDGTRWTYTYDPLGRRIAKYRQGADGSPVEAVCFTWDGARLAEQSDAAAGVTLTWDHDGHRPLTQYERKHLAQDQVDSRFFAIVTDLVGTPTELVDETGDIAWHTRATLWGTTTWNADAIAYTPLRFPGQYADPETALHYNHFRHYDPDTARFVTADPLGLEPGPNPVAYVHNPCVWTDPLGLSAFTPLNLGTSNFWKPVDYNGQRIYQRDDIINPDYVSPLDKYGRDNMKRMTQGLAPMGPDDKPVNLHHMLQTQDGPIAEVTQSMHLSQGDYAGSDSYNTLHWKAGSKIPSGIDRDAFADWKKDYWKDRARALSAGRCKK